MTIVLYIYINNYKKFGSSSGTYIFFASATVNKYIKSRRQRLQASFGLIGLNLSVGFPRIYSGVTVELKIVAVNDDDTE